MSRTIERLTELRRTIAASNLKRATATADDKAKAASAAAKLAGKMHGEGRPPAEIAEAAAEAVRASVNPYLTDPAGLDEVADAAKVAAMTAASPQTSAELVKRAVHTAALAAGKR